MGVSLHVENCPTEYIECTWVDSDISNDELVSLRLYRGADGKIYEDAPVCPELQITESSARVLFEIAGMAHLDSMSGALNGEELSRFHAGLMRAKNIASRMNAAQSWYTDDGRFYSMGYDVARITSLVDRALRLTHYCQRHGHALCWV